MKKMAASFLLMLLCAGLSAPSRGEEKWRGIDESVVEKFAQERGREAAEPFLPVEGDLLLFLFALAGGIGGFIMGFFWHKVFVAGRHDPDEKNPDGR